MKKKVFQKFPFRAFQTFDDGMKYITNELALQNTLNDGAIKIYKSQAKDITMIVCNTPKNNQKIFNWRLQSKVY